MYSTAMLGGYSCIFVAIFGTSINALILFVVAKDPTVRKF